MFLEVYLALTDDSLAACGGMLDADACIEQAQVLGDLSDGGDSGLAGASGDSLLNCDGGGDTVHLVDFSTRHLFDELTRVGGHRFHEAALALGKDDVESEGGFT